MFEDEVRIALLQHTVAPVKEFILGILRILWILDLLVRSEGSRRRGFKVGLEDLTVFVENTLEQVGGLYHLVWNRLRYANCFVLWAVSCV